MKTFPLIIEKRRFVIPGDLLAEGNYSAGENTYKEGDRVYSSMVGLSNNVGRKVFVSAFQGRYIPRVEDLVIGTVTDMRLGSWIVEIDAPTRAVLLTSEVFDRPFNSKKEDMRQVFNTGDLILAKVIALDRTRDPALTVREPGLGKIGHGRIAKITPTKIPRVIGRAGSMINLLKHETKCQITIGQNGWILISGKTELEDLAIQIISIIEENAHTSGLTDRISKFIKQKKGG